MVSKIKPEDLADDFDASSDEEGIFPSITTKKSQSTRFEQQSEDDASDGEDENDEDDDKKDSEALDIPTNENTPHALNKKLLKMTPEHLAKLQRRVRKSGVVHLTTVPPFMQPQKLRQIMSRFGKVDRLFLQPEEEKSRRNRIKSGGNKRQSYVQGWVEFEKKRHAKRAVEVLNGNIIGGRKGDRYHDDILNLKYLSKFTWQDLQQQIATENEVRQAKLQLDISQERKLNKTFVENVERAKAMERAISRKRELAEENDQEFRDEKRAHRQYAQRNITSTRADASSKFEKEKAGKTLNSVIDQIF
ncbi:pre-rRNA-processing protein Esf2p [Diutina catenulata]